MGAGRKPKAAAERLRNPVQVSFTDAERAAIEAAAGDEALAAFIRRLVVRHLARRRK